ncbi:hypothetical protein PPH41_07390 [Burkholderia gladioli]|nr:hypothetical protein [Burkholderia gladioli]
MTKPLDRERIAREFEMATEVLYQASTLFDVIARLVSHGEEDKVDLMGLCRLGIDQMNVCAQRVHDMTKEVRHG